ncbi:MAG: hypothetical protein NTX58_09525 [Actinobacteria bacterium]|nr:hypothetical protein [Actinomycetota bacterium]
MSDRLDPTVDVKHDEPFVDDGDIISSAGVFAGSDMALHLLRRLAGIDLARQIGRGI